MVESGILQQSGTESSLWQDASMLADILKKEYGVKHILTGYMGTVLGAHTGPGVMGLFHIGSCR